MDRIIYEHLIYFLQFSSLQRRKIQDTIRVVGLSIIFIFSIFLELIVNAQSPQITLLSKTHQRRIDSLLTACEEQFQTDPKGVIRLADRGRFLAQKVKDTSAYISFTDYLGLMHFKIGCIDSSLLHHMRSKDLAILFKDSAHILSSHNNLGYYYYAIGDYDLGEIHYDHAAQMARDLQNYQAIQNILVDKANFKSRRGLYSDALWIIEKNIVYSQRHELDISRLNLKKAQHLSHLARYSESLHLLFNLKNDVSKDSLFLTYIDREVGSILMKNQLYSEALRYFESVHSYFFKTELLFDKIQSLQDLGSVYLALGEKGKAGTILRRCIALQDEKEISCSGSILYNLASVCPEHDKSSCSTQYLERAYNRFKEVDDRQGMADVHNSLALIALDSGDLDNALFRASKAKDIAEYHEYAETLLTSYGLLFDIYRLKGNMNHALASKTLFDKINDELKDPEKVFSISREILRKEYLKFEKSEFESANTHYFRGMLISLGIVILFLSLLGYRYYTSNKSSNGSTAKLISKNKVVLMTPKDSAELQKKLLDFMDQSKPYLNQDIGLTDLAVHLRTTDKKLSYLLNQELNTNFYDFVNGYRVNAFKEMANQNSASQLSIIGMAEECGFASKSSFYRAFKKETGMTPSQFLKNDL